jgi:hypothetical protein
MQFTPSFSTSCHKRIAEAGKNKSGTVPDKWGVTGDKAGATGDTVRILDTKLRNEGRSHENGTSDAGRSPEKLY